MTGEVDSFYPFLVTYARIKEDEWLAYDDNWTDGFIHRVFLINSVFYEKRGSSYDDSYRDDKPIRCNPNVRQAFAAVPYTAEYTENDGTLFCPNQHKAIYNYPFPGCFDIECPFNRCRQHHYSDSSEYPWSKGKVIMGITINGETFNKNKHFRRR